MPKAAVHVYDLQMRKVAMLENAFDIGYETPFNGLWTASFSLPANDPKTKECKPLYFVELFDGNERVELFRILPNTIKRSDDGATVSYQCEHVLATLIDDVLFQYHTIGNLGVYTSDVISYILSKQTVNRWNLGAVEFNRQFEYNWENDTLLSALISVPKPFVGPYMWKWDTTSYPWTLSLVAPPEKVEAYIRYGVNMQGIEKQVDPSSVATRIYGLGYGEGVNQLTFAEINNGLPYVEDAAAQQIYGVINRVFVDRRFMYPETLKARCEAILNESKEPRVSYSVDASELHKLTNQPMHKFTVGKIVRVQDQELGIDINARVVNVSKGDIFGNPGVVTIEIANRSQDIAGSIADLADRQRINDSYAQGATNYDSHDFADNCDPDHPAILKFWIPEETVRINKVVISYESSGFRAYERAIEAAGEVAKSTSSGGGVTPTTSTDEQKVRATTYKSAEVKSSTTSREWNTIPGIYVPDGMSAAGAHNHGIQPGTQLATVGGGAVTWVAAENHSHILTADHHHEVTIPGHDHEVTIPSHNHTVTIPEHTHEIQIPAHTHDIEFGIYEGPSPSSVTIKVDGAEMPVTQSSGDSIDIVPYLSKDGEGKINRGTWHTVEITPDTLGRIVASVNLQLFVASRGGGNY